MCIFILNWYKTLILSLLIQQFDKNYVHQSRNGRTIRILRYSLWQDDYPESIVATTAAETRHPGYEVLDPNPFMVLRLLGDYMLSVSSAIALVNFSRV